jgi:DNA-binding transcriptional LysR family regulator
VLAEKGGLLDRGRQGVEATDYGRALIDCGVAIFDDLRQGLSRIKFLADPTAGEVRIGTTAFLAASLVSAVIDRVSKRYPRIAFRIVARPETLRRELSERQLDLLITRRFDYLADDQFDFELLFHDPFVVAAGARNPWVRRRGYGLADLVKERWVLPPQGMGLWSVARESFRKIGLDLSGATVVADLPEIRVGLLATGRFLTIFPASVLKFPAKRQGIKVLPVEVPVSSVPVGIVTLKNRTLSPVAQIFREYAREIARPLAQHGR